MDEDEWMHASMHACMTMDKGTIETHMEELNRTTLPLKVEDTIEEMEADVEEEVVVEEEVFPSTLSRS